ncbi:MAG: thiolase family protein [Alphaproteobacteria bacterium]|nr:thiolase family protein [Alphaproteobacteria bacterium]
MNLGEVAAIIGVGDAYANLENRKDPLQLATEATYKAIKDAGIKKQQIDALYTGRAPWADRRPQWSNIFASHIQLPVVLTTELTMHGAGVNIMLGVAVQTIATGRADYVLCVQSDATSLFIDTVAVGAATDADPQYEYPFGPIIPALYGQSARRYFHEFGLTENDLADIAVSHQKWGAHHPHAAKAKFGEVDREKVLASPYVATPLRRWMCSTWGGGTAGAFVVTSVENAKKAKNPLYIRGFGSATTHEYLTERMALRECKFPNMGVLPNITHTSAREASRQAYAMADMTPGDMDMAQISANFAHMALILMEDIGFAEKGKGMDLYREGRTAPGGDLPTDTNGGWLSFGQPGISCDMDSLIEAARQLRGEALGLQVPGNPKTAIVQGAGGMLACNGVTIFSTEAP